MIVGTKVGARVGPVVGLDFGGGNPLASVTKDATSGIFTPASASEWSAFISAKGLSIAVPDAIWLLQEASGNPTDSGSSGLFGLTASGTGLAYQQAVAGWSRKAITFTDGGTGLLKSTSASLPDISTTSQFTVLLANITATPAAVRNIITQGTTTKASINVTITPRARAVSGANISDGTTSPTGAVRPWGLRTNRTAGSTTGFTDVEKLVPTFSTSLTGKTVGIGSNGSSSPAMAVLYGWQWNGANAEISDANFKALLQALGLTIGWT